MVLSQPYRCGPLPNQRSSDAAVAMRRLDEDIENIAALVLCRMGRVRWPVDYHQADPGDRHEIIFNDETKIRPADQSRLEPSEE